MSSLLAVWLFALPAPVLAQNDVPTNSPAATAAPVAGGEESSGKKPAPDGPSPVMTIVMFGGIFLVFWLFIIRPQNKKMKEHQALISKIKIDDRVVTQGGILGTIKGFDDSSNSVKIEIARDVVIRVLRSQVAGLQGTPETEAALKQAADGGSKG